MTELLKKQYRALKGLVGTMPTTMLKSLSLALQGSNDKLLMPVYELVQSEAKSRSLRDLVFAAYRPLFEPRQDSIEFRPFSAWILPQIWEALLETDANLIKRATADLEHAGRDDGIPPSFSEVIKTAASLCRLKGERLKPAYVNGDVREELEECAHYFDLNRVAQDVLGRLNDFTQRPSEERSAAMKIYYKDACAIHEGSGVRLLEIIFANLMEPINLLKVISVIGDHPQDRFMAASELASFGERFLVDFERTSHNVLQALKKRIDAPDLVENSGVILSQTLRQINIFQKSIELTKDGPWGRRLSVVQGNIVSTIEEKIRASERLLSEVLPVTRGRSGRNTPRLDREPRSEQISAIKSCLSFMHDVQDTASISGYASLLSTTKKALEQAVDEYFEGLLAVANDPDGFDYTPLMLAFDRLEDIMHHLCGGEKAALARRRVACIPAIASYKNLAS